MNIKTPLALIAAGLAVGCMSQTELPQDVDGTIAFEDVTAEQNPDYRDLVGQLPVRNGTLDGDVGVTAGLRSADQTEVSGWGEPYYASIYTVGQGRNGAAMTILEIEGGLNNAELQPGAHFEFDLYDNEPGSSLHAYVVGCSGPVENEWDFDHVADTTTIDVSAHPTNPDVLVLDYAAEFGQWEAEAPTIVTGRIEVEREPNG